MSCSNYKSALFSKSMSLHPISRATISVPKRNTSNPGCMTIKYLETAKSEPGSHKLVYTVKM